MKHEEELYKGQKAALTKLLKNRSWRILSIALQPIGMLYMAKYLFSVNIEHIHLLSLLLLLISLPSILYIKIGYSKHLSLFLHNYYASPNIFACGYLLAVCLFALAVLCVAIGKYYYIFTIFIFLFAVGIHLLQRISNLVKTNFIYYYYELDDIILFDQNYFIKGFHELVHVIYHVFTGALVFAAALFGIYGHSFKDNYAFTISLCICLFGMFINFYPYYVYSLYFFIVIHPRVKKAFNKPVMSDPRNVFSLDEIDVELDDNFFGGNNVKRIIQYGEVCKNY